MGGHAPGQGLSWLIGGAPYRATPPGTRPGSELQPLQDAPQLLGLDAGHGLLG